MDSLPVECFVYIGSFLSPNDLWNLSTCCKSLKEYFTYDAVWELIVKHIISKHYLPSANHSWYSYYMNLRNCKLSKLLKNSNIILDYWRLTAVLAEEAENYAVALTEYSFFKPGVYYFTVRVLQDPDRFTSIKECRGAIACVPSNISLSSGEHSITSNGGCSLSIAVGLIMQHNKTIIAKAPNGIQVRDIVTSRLRITKSGLAELSYFINNKIAGTAIISQSLEQPLHFGLVLWPGIWFQIIPSSET